LPCSRFRSFFAFPGLGWDLSWGFVEDRDSFSLALVSSVAVPLHHFPRNMPRERHNRRITGLTFRKGRNKRVSAVVPTAGDALPVHAGGGAVVRVAAGLHNGFGAGLSDSKSDVRVADHETECLRRAAARLEIGGDGDDEG
jgi:hypothetical protein